ncbi:MAG: hypothetical protein HDR01_00130 [Lachnospiraceae bacterium]|nr:hypothetical protein [Lachnospiraceae bacterium]
MIGIHFSGMGNTRFCVEYLLKNIEHGARAYSIEDKKALEELENFINKEGPPGMG